MKSALVAVDPTALQGPRFEKFCEAIRFLQDKHFIGRTSVAAVMNSSQYLAPAGFYRSNKRNLAKQASLNVRLACEDRFDHESVQILQADSSSNEDLVARLTRFARTLRSDLLVMSSIDRRGLPYWFLGSVTETAVLSAAVSVLVLKYTAFSGRLSRNPRLVVSIDVSAPPSTRDLAWLADLSRSSKAALSLVYVQPRKRAGIASLREIRDRKEAEQTLHRLATALRAKGAVGATATVLAESRSIAHAIVEFAEAEKAWMIVATTAKRTRIQRFFLGSNARRILALSRSAFLSLRLE